MVVFYIYPNNITMLLMLNWSIHNCKPFLIVICLEVPLIPRPPFEYKNMSINVTFISKSIVK